jgi:hypothetical protein
MSSFKSNPFSKVFGVNARNISLAFNRHYDSVIRHWCGFRKGLSGHAWRWNWNFNGDFKSKEQRQRFFSEYRSHSKAIGKVISEGFGRTPNLMGHCDYQNGCLDRVDPKDYQSTENVGLGRQHLQKGYPEIWKKKQQLEKEILVIHNEISDVVDEFQQIISSSIPKEFKIRDSHPPKYLPYYDDRHTYWYLFEQMNMKLNGNPILQPSFREEKIHLAKPDDTMVSVETFCLFMKLPLAFGDRVQLEEFRKVLDGLILNQQINELVHEYKNLETELSTLGKEDYYTDIDNLWNEIYENGNELQGKGACRNCQKHKLFDYF